MRSVACKLLGLNKNRIAVDGSKKGSLAVLPQIFRRAISQLGG